MSNLSISRIDILYVEFKFHIIQGMFNSCDKVVLKNITRKKTQQVFLEKLTENKGSFYLKMKIQNEAIKSSGFLL